MNIQNVTSGLNPTNPSKQITPAKTGEMHSGVPTDGATSSRTDRSHDRVDLSRHVSGKELTPEQSRELAFARQALHSLPSMSEERLAKIRSHIENGNYSRLEIISNVANRLAETISGENHPLPPYSDPGEVHPLPPISDSGDTHPLPPISDSGDTHTLPPILDSGDTHTLPPISDSGNTHPLPPISDSGDTHTLPPISNGPNRG